MHCPFCRHTDSRVIDSPHHRRRHAHPPAPPVPRVRPPLHHASRRRSLTVVKRSGATEPFSRDKVLVGVRKACQGRPVTEDDLALLAQRVEETHPRPGQRRDRRARGRPGRSSGRCASSTRSPTCGSPRVYQAFDTLEDFEAAITLLRAERDAAGRGAGAPARADAAAASTTACQHHRQPARPRVGATAVHRETPARAEPRSGRPARHDGDRHGARAGARKASRARACTIERIYTTAGVHPYDEVTWERATSSSRTGRPARRSSSSAASSSPTSGRSTPPRSSPPSTSAAPSAPTPARPASSSSSTASC